MKRSTRILWGLFAPALAAVLFVAGEFVLARSDLLMNPGADPEAFAQMVTGSGFAFYAGRGVVGVFLETVGMIALYLYLENSRVERLAFWGALISILGDMAGAAFFGSMLLVYPSVGAVGLEARRRRSRRLAFPRFSWGRCLSSQSSGSCSWPSPSGNPGRSPGGRALPRWSGAPPVVGRGDARRVSPPSRADFCRTDSR